MASQPWYASPSACQNGLSPNAAYPRWSSGRVDGGSMPTPHGTPDADLTRGPAEIAATFGELWTRRVAASPAATFLVFQELDHSTRTWTYEEFDKAVAAMAGYLTACGVLRGDAVHVALRNCPGFLAAWLACARLGAWIVPVDPASGERELATQMERVKPRLGLYGATRSGAYRAAASQRGLEALELPESAEDILHVLAAGGGDSTAVSADTTTLAPTDRLAVMFTSGTTSRPKGVVLTQANYLNVAVTMSAAVDLGPDDRWLVTLPLFHANAQYYCFAPAIAAGASVALTARFSASRWTQSARELRATHASLFAAPIRMILAKNPAGSRANLKHVWFAQSLGADHYDEFADLAGVRARQLYGMTETVAIVSADDPLNLSHDVIGKPLNGRRVRLIDPTTCAEAAPGENGVIQVAGERGVDLFVEYLDDPDTTNNSFTQSNGVTWFSTGDLAAAGADGTMRFVGRVDDVIKVSGENVSLTEVESTIAQAPGVLEAAVVAKPDPIRDQVPVAYVVPRDPATPPDVDALARWAERELAPAARPREWHVIAELPRTSVGKVRRFAMAQFGPAPAR
ncbi:class I adenylate-forming enzyme family protein [Sphaerisporangium sp. NPDC051011]|uniref:class I adenylate-forming enzyme family protein n=1 Tax=Sphaerisporangium sp. NPDC051011 TaxID=3155792 RepID=UPI0033E9FA1E